MRWLVAILIGVGLGVVAGVADTVVSHHPTSYVRVLAIATGSVSVWVLAAVVGGWLVARQPWAALGGLLVLVGGLAGWVGWAATRPGARLGLDLLPSQTRYWAITGLVVGPMLGLLGAVARSNSFFGLAARISAPIALVAEMFMRHETSGRMFSVDPMLAWTSVCLMVAGVLMAAIAVVGQQHSSQ